MNSPNLPATWSLVAVAGLGHTQAPFPCESDPLPIVQVGGLTTGTVWTIAENVAPTGLRSPDVPGRS